MNAKNIVVRIVQPADKPQIAPLRVAPLVHHEEHQFSRQLFQALGMVAIALLGTYLTVSFFHLGLSFNDLMVILGIPVALGLVTTYVLV